MATKKVWVLSLPKKTLTEKEKQVLEKLFEPLISEYKFTFIEAEPDKKYNYVIDFYSKFYRGFFYLCAKYIAEYKNRIVDEFETKFARVEFVDENKYNLAYYWHTGQWWTSDKNATAEYCLKNIKDNPLFFL